MEVVQKLILELPNPYREVNILVRPENWKMDAHSHAYFQLILVIEGCLTIESAENYQLKRGSVVIIPPKISHTLSTNEGYVQVGINFSPEKDERGMITFLENYVGNTVLFKKNHSANRIFELIHQESCYTQASRIKLSAMLDTVILNDICAAIQTSGNMGNRLLDLLNKYLTGTVQMKDLSKELFLSPAQLERIAHRAFGSSVLTLFYQLKMNKACMLLREPSYTLQEISELLGFYDQAHFSRFFKKKSGISPLAYRKKYME